MRLRHEHHGLVPLGVELFPRGSDSLHAELAERRLELPPQHLDALSPGMGGKVRWSLRECAVQVVEEGEQSRDDLALSDLAINDPFLRDSPLEVLKVGSLAPQEIEQFVRVNLLPSIGRSGFGCGPARRLPCWPRLTHDSLLSTWCHRASGGYLDVVLGPGDARRRRGDLLRGAALLDSWHSAAQHDVVTSPFISVNRDCDSLHVQMEVASESVRDHPLQLGWGQSLRPPETHQVSGAGDAGDMPHAVLGIVALVFPLDLAVQCDPAPGC